MRREIFFNLKRNFFCFYILYFYAGAASAASPSPEWNNLSRFEAREHHAGQVGEHRAVLVGEHHSGQAGEHHAGQVGEHQLE